MARPAERSLKIADDLRRRIARGEWRSGTLIPGRLDLARSYGVALNTLQRAIAPLIADGSLQPVGRRGTRVAEDPAAARHARGARVTLVGNADGDPRLPESWVARAVRGAERALSAAGAASAFVDVRHPTARGRADLAAALAAIEAERPDAIAVIDPAATPGWEAVVEAFSRRWRGPFARVAAGPRAGAPTAYVDQRAAGADAARHLIDAGYRRLIALAPYREDWLDERIAGARAAAGRGALTTWPARAAGTAIAFWERGRAHQAAWVDGALRAALRGRDDGPIAIVAPNDVAAADAVAALERLGREVGGDIGVIGFDDSVAARDAGLTTMAPPLEEQGAAVARLLLDALAGGSPARRTPLRSTVIVRASTFRRATAESA